MESLSHRERMIFCVVLLLTAFIDPICAADVSNCTISRVLDVAIVFDASQSMANQHLGTLKNYLSNLIKIFDIDEKDKSKGVRISLYGHTYGALPLCNFSTCSSENETLDIINKIPPMGLTAVNIAKMFAFIRDHAFLQTPGTREKIAIAVLDSPVLPYTETASQIKAGLQKNNITTFAVVIEDKGVKVTYITPFLNGPGLVVPTITNLTTFTGVRKELKSRYGCSKCHPNPCRNNGTCVDKLLPPYFKCKCEAGWKGDRCEVEDPCAVCSTHGGQCVVVPESAATKCLCRPDKTGSHCQFRNLCYPPPGPCKNGASCTPNKTVANEYSCSCVGNFTGKNCDIPSSGPCAGNPCNGQTCVAIAPTLHRCVCPSYCANPPNCSACKKIEPCKPNPCQNGCQCKESANHEGGFLCSSPAGYLGKLCDVARAEVKCEPAYIEVRIPETAVKQYEAGVIGGLVYISPISKNVYSCVGVLDSTRKYREVKIPVPFQSCGTTRTPLGSGFEYTNTVWLNRANSLLDMPVPILKFKCVYGDSQKIISTALKPAIGNAPALTISGRFRVQMEAYMRAPGAKDRGHITRGSVYTVGDMVYLTAALMTNTSRQLVVKLVNCYASANPTLKHGGVDLVTNGCPEKSNGVTVLSNAQQTSATIGFKAFQLRASQICYYSCQVYVCDKSDPTCKPTVCSSGRKKRSVDFPVSNVLRFGPLIIVNPLERDNGTDLPSGRGVPVIISGNLLTESEEGFIADDLKATSTRASYAIMATLASFIALVIMSGILLCILIRRKRELIQ